MDEPTEFDYCCVAGEGCEAPIVYAGPNGYFSMPAQDIPLCAACGMPVCRKCSRVLEWYNFGQQRVCDWCREEHGIE